MVPPRAAAAVVVALAGALAVSSAAAPSGRGSAWTNLAHQADGSAWTSAVHLDPGLHAVGNAAQHVIVSGRHGVAATAEAVRRLGGTVQKPLDIVDGVAATVPGSRLGELSRDPAVGAVTADRRTQFEDFTYSDTTVASNFVKTARVGTTWSKGYLGSGIGVAVLDTGISEMPDFAGRLVHGPDLSGEGTLVDNYGHGTAMAGAVGGSGQDSASQKGGAYTGAAPKATLVAVKVAGRNGVADVSTVLAGMHWVSAYKDQFNIRVLNLSWGTASTQDPAVDPLNYAVERLWKQGIVVVVAAGNSGPNSGTITKPADDPLVITASAYDDKGNLDASDDALPAWSSRGPTAQGLTKPDLLVPGRTIVTARSYGSYVEVSNPKALVAPSYIKGSGTSQAAAVTSGLAALILAAHPDYTPDQVKQVLKSTAVPMPGKTANEQGAGRVNLNGAQTADPGPAASQVGSANGLGSIEASRAGNHVTTSCNGTSTVIQGEMDVNCQAWNGSSWTGSSWTGSSWTGSSWTGSSWTGSSWTGSSWTGSSWTGSSWTGGTWNGSSWTGSSWTGSSWQGSSWQGSSWTGSSWQGSSWTTAEYEEFQTAFWGNKPKKGKKVAGEPEETEDASP
jgi:serine protease AprX